MTIISDWTQTSGTQHLKLHGEDYVGSQIRCFAVKLNPPVEAGSYMGWAAATMCDGFDSPSQAFPTLREAQAYAEERGDLLKALPATITSHLAHS